MAFKSQAVLISAVILVVIFATLYFSLDFRVLLERKAMLESATIITAEISNIKDEIEAIPSIAFYASDEVLIGYLKNFTEFVRESYEARGRKVGTVLLLAFNGTPIVASENTTLNISILNQRTEPLFDLKLNFSYDGSLRKEEIIPDKYLYNTSFTFNASSDVNYILAISFRSKLFGVVTDEIPIPIKIGEEFKSIWSDVAIAGE